MILLLKKSLRRMADRNHLGENQQQFRVWKVWWKTKLEIHYSIYKDSLHAFNLELATARQTFFSNLINRNLNNNRPLFATVERLTNPPSQIPSEMLSDSKCNEFASFFSEINNIRKAIGTSSSYAEVRQIRPQFQKEVASFKFIFFLINVHTAPHIDRKTQNCWHFCRFIKKEKLKYLMVLSIQTLCSVFSRSTLLI